MNLPISFEEVSYFNNEYRGDLIVTKGVLYYFPHTRVNYARRADELKPSLPHEDALRNSPAGHPDFFKVPKVIER